MEQDASSFGCERLTAVEQLRLRFGAEFVAKHDHHVAGRVCDDLSCRVDLTRFDTGFLRRECIVR